MNVLKVLVAVVVVIVGDHLFGLALEAHALVASSASDPVAAVRPLDGELALVVGTFADVVFLHVLLEKGVSAHLCLLAGQPRVVELLALDTV